MSHQWSKTVVLFIAMPTLAWAADGDPFDPSGSISHGAGGILTEAPTLTAQGVSAGLLANIAESLVVNEFSDGSEVAVLDSTLALSLYGGYTYKDIFRVEAFIPAYGYVDAPGQDFAGPAFGDLRIQALFPIVDNGDSFGFALMPRLTLPTGTGNALLRRGTSFGAVAVVGGETDMGLGWAGNVGLTLSGSDSIGDVTVGSDVDAKGTVYYRVDDAFRVGLEGQGLMGLSRAEDERRQSLATADLFAQITSPQGIGMTVGLGTGSGVGAPEYRLFAGLTYAPLFPDADGDGYRDAEDGCPSAAEDFDMFEDEDGCPDSDNDEDGILDLADGCPMDVEDMDGWEDEDGCPDPDNDGDVTPDVTDECPDILGPPDMRGCPDSDRDGTADKDDACPDEPGEPAMQGCPDRDGDKVPDFRDECPDEPIPEDAVAETSNGCPSRVYVVDGAIRITERVNFDTGRATIRPDSYGLLDDVASIIKENPQARKIQVGGHTDDRGDAANNQRLSQSRAEAVMTYLVGKGVSSSRLDARGFGQERPIDTNRTTAGRATNRRVEFTITETTPVEVTVPPAPGPAAPAAVTPASPAAPAPRIQPTLPTATPDAPAPMERPTPGDSPWTMPADEAPVDQAEDIVEDVIEDVVEEVPAEPVVNDLILPEGMDDGDDGAGPSDDLEETLRRGGNPWGPR